MILQSVFLRYIYHLEKEGESIIQIEAGATSSTTVGCARSTINSKLLQHKKRCQRENKNGVSLNNATIDYDFMLQIYTFILKETSLLGEFRAWYATNPMEQMVKISITCQDELSAKREDIRPYAT